MTSPEINRSGVDKAVLILASLGIDTGADSERINDGAQVMESLFWAPAGVQNQARNGYP